MSVHYGGRGPGHVARNQGGVVLSLPTTGLLWDSDEDPANGTVVPGTVTADLSTAEIVIVARGHTNSPLDLGNGSQGMFYGAGVNDATIGVVYMFDGGFRQLFPSSFLPRLAPTIIGYRGNGSSSFRGQINGVLGSAVGGTTATVTGGLVGGRVGGGFEWDGSINRVLIYSTNMSAGDRAMLYAYLRFTYDLEAYTKQVLCVGDSLTGGYHSANNIVSNGWTGGDYTHSYPYEIATANPDWKVLNHGITSVTVATMLTNDTGAIDPYYDATNFTDNVVVFWGGTNDLVGGTALATVQTRCSDYFAARKALGFKVVAVPMVDRSGFSAGQRTDKDTFNTWMAGLVGTGIDAIVTLPTQLAGNSPWSTYPTYWDGDTTHLTRLGYQAIAPAISTAVSAA